METNTEGSTAVKRKRSPSFSNSTTSTAPVSKASKTASTQLSINYLARQSHEDLPLINKEDALPNLLQLLALYSNVLDRHESLASNLGARPLGPILIKRFERCFDAPPKIVASHHKGAATDPETSAHQITWLEVIEFARAHPGQFTLSTYSEGKRVCQFYYPQKQLRVQVSEEDFLFINSGRCQELIPPLPIWEDEEKEVATCDVLESKLKELTNAADMIAARTRQLSHRLKGRKAAILERRAEGGSGTPAKAGVQQTTTAPPLCSPLGFAAVNAANGGRVGGDAEPSMLGNNATVRNDLLRHFESLPHNQTQSRPHARQQSLTASSDTFMPTQNSKDLHEERTTGGAGDGNPDSAASSLSPVPTNAFTHDPLSYYVTDAPTLPRMPSSVNHAPHRSQSSPSNHTIPTSTAHHTHSSNFKHNFSRPLPPALESSQPFRPLCQANMDSLPRNSRVIPPCDRCRRLRMDCVKNLTSCQGCTRKHARCHWRDVEREEVEALDFEMDAQEGHASPRAPEGADGGVTSVSASAAQGGLTNGYGLHDYVGAVSEDEGARNDDSDDEDDSNPLEDLEAVGEEAVREHEAAREELRLDEEGLLRAKDLSREAVRKLSGLEIKSGANGATDRPSGESMVNGTEVDDRFQGQVVSDRSARRPGFESQGASGEAHTSNGVIGHESEAEQVNGTTIPTKRVLPHGEIQQARPAASEAAKEVLPHDSYHESEATRARDAVNYGNSTQNSTAFVPLLNGSSPTQDHHEDHDPPTSLLGETQNATPAPRDVVRELDHRFNHVEAGDTGIGAVGKTDEVLPATMNADVNGNDNGAPAYAGFRAVNEVVGGWRAA